MKTRSLENRGSTSSYRSSLRPAMRSIFTAPFFSLLLTRGPQWEHPRRWTVEYVIYVSLLMVLDDSETLKDRFTHARQTVVAMFPSRKRPGRTYQGYVKARGQVRRHYLRAIQQQLRDHQHRIAAAWWQRDGWVAFAADGTRIELPRTAANERAFGCAGRDKTGPQLQVTSLYHLGLGLPWAWRIGAGTESEQVHLRQMVKWLPRGALLVADAGFTSFDLLRSLAGRQVEVLVRMGSNRTLLTALEDVRVRIKGEMVWLWPTKKQSKYPPLKLRLIRLEQANHTPMCLVTSVLDEQALTDRQIGQFYRMRWGQEVFHRSFKQTLAQHKMRSGSAAEARSELDWALLGYLILGLWSAEALIGAGHDPLQWSPAESLRVVRGALRQGGRPARRGALGSFLRQAVKDRYVRTGSKSARNWPRKKNDHPPGVPKLREATEKEKHCAQRTYERIATT
jgi:hypothetical protein